MRIKNIVLAMVVIFVVAASASAGNLFYSTNAAGTLFVGGVNSLTLNSTSGPNATLVFTPNPGQSTTTPSNIDLGEFDLYCTGGSNGCTASSNTVFGAFTFDLVVTDTTDNNAIGQFVGTSTGGNVNLTGSTINVNWTPTQLGPGTLNALSGNFGMTEFLKQQPLTSIVAPNSGDNPGRTTVQAYVVSAPEPSSFALIGGALLGIGVLRRKILSRP